MANKKYNESQKTEILAQFKELKKTMSKHQAAIKLGMNTSTISNWLRDGKAENKKAITVKKVDIEMVPAKMFAFYGTKAEILDLVRSI